MTTSAVRAEKPKKARPVFRLTLPEEEAAALRAAYAAATVILEYGSGGSTLVAADPARHVMSVESDADWAERLQAHLAEAHPGCTVHVHHADIGPTLRWGRPQTNARFRDYHLYATGVWDAPWFRQPDVVLIDGRFRTACFATVLLRTQAPVTVLFDDYAERPYYHWVEELAPVAARHGRMAEFRIAPGQPPMRALSRIAGAFVDAR